MEVLRWIAEVLSANNFNLLFHLAHEKVPYERLYSQRNVDGLILMSIPIDDPNIQGLEASGAPWVCTCRVSEGDDAVNWVDADFASGVEQTMDHLISLGHRRIALLAGPMNLVSVRLRLRGYRAALRKYGLPETGGYVLEGDFTSEAGHSLALQAMRHPQPPSALICGDDMMAFGAIQALKELGYRVPEDVSIVGFDDVNLARFSSPPLTTVRQDTYQKGRIAADTLLTLMRGATITHPIQTVLDTSLVVRDSTAPVKNA
jgi:DNA-binding LacI/PurR family transcriptional regulator